MDVHSAFLNKYLNEEVEELCFSSIMKNMKENNLSKNINNVVKNSVNDDKDAILTIKDVHEGVTKDVGLGNMSLLNEDIVLRYLSQMRITLETMLSK